MIAIFSGERAAKIKDVYVIEGRINNNLQGQTHTFNIDDLVIWLIGYLLMPYVIKYKYEIN
jgi:hypothetical protein